VADAQFLFQPDQGAWNGLASVRAPVLVGGGRRDVVVPPGNARIIAARLHRPTLRLYPAAHFFYTQNRNQFVPDLLRFLRAGLRRTP
jgi:pimeloyl-ACP methyl ester carboxylesterase